MNFWKRGRSATPPNQHYHKTELLPASSSYSRYFGTCRRFQISKAPFCFIPLSNCPAVEQLIRAIPFLSFQLLSKNPPSFSPWGNHLTPKAGPNAQFLHQDEIADCRSKGNGRWDVCVERGLHNIPKKIHTYSIQVGEGEGAKGSKHHRPLHLNAHPGSPPPPFCQIRVKENAFHLPAGLRLRVPFGSCNLLCLVKDQEDTYRADSPPLPDGTHVSRKSEFLLFPLFGRMREKGEQRRIKQSSVQPKGVFFLF